MKINFSLVAALAVVAVPTAVFAAAAPSVESAAGDKVRIVRVVYGEFDLAENWVVPGMADGRTAVIAGDAVYSRRNLAQRLPTPTSFNADESRAFVETYSDPRYRVYLCHD